jgi:hypothetical protein
MLGDGKVALLARLLEGEEDLVAEAAGGRL